MDCWSNGLVLHNKLKAIGHANTQACDGAVVTFRTHNSGHAGSGHAAVAAKRAETAQSPKQTKSRANEKQSKKVLTVKEALIDRDDACEQRIIFHAHVSRRKLCAYLDMHAWGWVFRHADWSSRCANEVSQWVNAKELNPTSTVSSSKQGI
eukprot:1148012-Pelagomonas_calceolata.AAC.2